MITDRRKGSARRKRVPERGQGALELVELPIHGDPDRLKDPGEIRRTRARTEHRSNGVHQVIAAL
jgi:hypothetical protein